MLARWELLPLGVHAMTAPKRWTHMGGYWHRAWRTWGWWVALGFCVLVWWVVIAAAVKLWPR